MSRELLKLIHSYNANKEIENVIYYHERMFKIWLSKLNKFYDPIFIRFEFVKESKCMSRSTAASSNVSTDTLTATGILRKRDSNLVSRCVVIIKQNDDGIFLLFAFFFLCNFLNFQNVLQWAYVISMIIIQ